MLYVHPAVAGQGVGAMLIDALEKLAAARGAAKLSSRRATPRATSSSIAALSRRQRNTVLRGDEWLANTTMEKKLATEHGAMKSKPSASITIIVAAIAIVVAVALALNYYLW